ncbi:MAG: non-canonical purine NTP pyrophosphatase [Candidatus Limnocylindrales bacterium]
MTPPGSTAGRDRSRLLVATRSTHKLRELRELLGLRAELIGLDDAGIAEEAIEDGETFEANASKKARFFATLSGLPTLADDSGLEVDALGGGPGVRTRRYAGETATDEDNNVKLLSALSGLDTSRRGARYRCVLALALPEAKGPRGGITVRLAHGTCEGRIATAPKGSGGFGYDPIFEPEAERPGGHTLGEWTAEAKNRISHRGKAARRMHRILAGLGF